MNLTKTISTRIDDMNRRLVKVLRLGKSDVQEPLEATPFGIDSNPLKDMVAVYSETGEKGKTVIIGYLNKNQKAGVGELRTYSTDTDGNEKFYTWMKTDGTMELGGDVDNLVRYQKLDDALQEFRVKLSTEITKIANGITIAGGVYIPGDVSIDISQSKIEQIKTL